MMQVLLDILCVSLPTNYIRTTTIEWFRLYMYIGCMVAVGSYNGEARALEGKKYATWVSCKPHICLGSIAPQETLQFQKGRWKIKSSHDAKVAVCAYLSLTPCSCQYIVPYTSKFSRCIIFAVFADFSNLQKLSSRNFRILYILQTLDPRKLFPRNVWKAQSAKIVRLEIWTYTVHFS